MRRLFGTALVLAWALFGAASAVAMTHGTRVFVCPVTGKTFEAVVQTSGTQFGSYLDLRPFGPIESPDPLPICPDASRFPLFKDRFSPAEAARIKQVVGTPEYKGLIAARHQPYYVVAWVKTLLRYDPTEVARDLLAASWTAQLGSEQQRGYLRESRARFSDAADAPGQTPRLVKASRFLQVELSRQLGEFDHAASLLDDWFPPSSASDQEPFAQHVAAERRALERREAGPVLVNGGRP